MKKLRLALFVSGTGSNALNIATYFSQHHAIEIGLFVSNNATSPALKAFEEMQIPCTVIDNNQAADGKFLIDLCTSHSIDYIVLAGYLRLIPASFINTYSDCIFNIHPALLPKFGGKGMYGNHVHAAVLEAGETESGITIHLVNEHFDEGRTLAQFHCIVEKHDSIESLRMKVQALEHSHYPEVIEQSLNKSTHV
jgi:phosphoribosylglycinamide formyltransferase-1